MQIHPPRRGGAQVLVVHPDVEELGACQGMTERRVDHTELGVDHLGGTACPVGNFPPRASAFQSLSTCLHATASCAR